MKDKTSKCHEDKRVGRDGGRVEWVEWVGEKIIFTGVKVSRPVISVQTLNAKKKEVFTFWRICIVP